MPPSDFVTDDHAKLICKIGQGRDCCRYLTMSPTGWSCEKLTDLGRALDMRVTTGTMVARGDNCEGRAAR